MIAAFRRRRIRAGVGGFAKAGIGSIEIFSRRIIQLSDCGAVLRVVIGKVGYTFRRFARVSLTGFGSACPGLVVNCPGIRRADWRFRTATTLCGFVIGRVGNSLVGILIEVVIFEFFQLAFEGIILVI